MEMQTHAQERALQRYNKELTEKDIECMKAIIRNNEHIPLGCTSDSKNKKFCYIKYNHIPYKILYKINHKRIRFITMYPFDFDEYNLLLEQKKEQKIRKAIRLLENEGYTVCKHS